jgi:drug/metabolite transporter (DMT)-like permease
MGLQATTAQRSGFLLYLNLKFVPFLAYLFYQRPIRPGTWISALTAFTGTALLPINPMLYPCQKQQVEQMLVSTFFL